MSPELLVGFMGGFCFGAIIMFWTMRRHYKKILDIRERWWKHVSGR